jgi:hypothetical protein
MNFEAENIKAEMKDGKLHIICDVSPAVLKKAPPSSTGKSKIVASTRGYVVLGDGLSLSLNLTTKKA